MMKLMADSLIAPIASSLLQPAASSLLNAYMEKGKRESSFHY